MTAQEPSTRSTRQVWRSQEVIPADWTGCILTMGVFDGFHRGHTELVRRTRERATRTGLAFVLLTFDPHPLTVIRPDRAPKMLLTIDERTTLAHSLGIDVVCVIPFTEALANITAEQFSRKVICERLRASAVIVGEDFRFGQGGRGNVGTLTQTGHRDGYEVEAVRTVEHEGQTCSSTSVRDYLRAGDRTKAEGILGRPGPWQSNPKPLGHR
ncbi:hypothetical protein OKJ48_05050 [Streptomyces kunmingensis]|uniref:FAD synthase n=1 Tax=Streptomyces kunmingensis TaxID=68225 RepID=A0ABU6C4G5_9ACTN|nr:hypothetical protein [Streptomyces kunmingensis]MEB3959620.1 hypothetical protein [Streptomyces kunmingensis]